MSVVGPRPHMVSHTEMYAKSVDKFMVRHFIKPGITGLAQTNGFRGEVENEKDIINSLSYAMRYGLLSYETTLIHKGKIFGILPTYHHFWNQSLKFAI